MFNPETATLSRGSHPQPEDGVCVMELVAFLAHELHGDAPACASRVIGAFLRRWNDDLDDDTRQRLLPYAALVLNTAAPAEVEERRAWLAMDWVVREYLPAWLELGAMAEPAIALRALPEINALTVSAAQPALDKAESAAAAARAAAWDAAEDTARDAALTAAQGAVQAAAGDAAWRAARSAQAAAGDATWDARDAAWSAAWDATVAAAGAKLAPTRDSLQESAFKLLDRMIACTEEKNV